MALTISPNFTNVLDPAKLGPQGELFLDGFIRQASLDFFQWMKVRPGSTRTVEMASIEPPGSYAAPSGEGDDPAWQAIAEGWPVSFTMSDVEIGYQVSRYSAQFIDPLLVAEFIRQLGFSAGRKMQADAYGVLTGGFSDTGPDGVSTFNSSHPAKSGSMSVQSNVGSTALDYTSLSAALTQGARLKSPDGLIAGVRYSRLVVPPDLEITARQMLSATVTPGTLDSLNSDSTDATTAHQPNLVPSYISSIHVAPDISDANDWFLLTEDPAFYMFVRKGPSPKIYTDVDSGNLRMRDDMTYAVGHRNAWRDAFGASVA